MNRRCCLPASSGIVNYVAAVICFCPLVAGCNTIEQSRTNGHDSVDAAQKFVRDYPANSNAYADLGNAWRDQGQYQLAIASHKKALLLDSKDATTYAELGDDYIAARQKDKAYTEWKTALRLDKHVPPTETRLHVERMLNKYSTKKD